MSFDQLVAEHERWLARRRTYNMYIRYPVSAVAGGVAGYAIGHLPVHLMVVTAVCVGAILLVTILAPMPRRPA